MHIGLGSQNQAWVLALRLTCFLALHVMPLLHVLLSLPAKLGWLSFSFNVQSSARPEWIKYRNWTGHFVAQLPHCLNEYPVTWFGNASVTYSGSIAFLWIVLEGLFDLIHYAPPFLWKSGQTSKSLWPQNSMTFPIDPKDGVLSLCIRIIVILKSYAVDILQVVERAAFVNCVPVYSSTSEAGCLGIFCLDDVP